MYSINTQSRNSSIFNQSPGRQRYSWLMGYSQFVLAHNSSLLTIDLAHSSFLLTILSYSQFLLTSIHPCSQFTLTHNSFLLTIRPFSQFVLSHNSSFLTIRSYSIFPYSNNSPLHAIHSYQLSYPIWIITFLIYLSHIPMMICRFYVKYPDTSWVLEHRTNCIISTQPSYSLSYSSQNLIIS